MDHNGDHVEGGARFVRAIVLNSTPGLHHTKIRSSVAVKADVASDEDSKSASVERMLLTRRQIVDLGELHAKPSKLSILRTVPDCFGMSEWLGSNDR